MGIGPVGLEKRIVAIRTGKHAQVLAVFKNHLPEIGNDNGYGINGMAA